MPGFFEKAKKRIKKSKIFPIINGIIKLSNYLRNAMIASYLNKEFKKMGIDYITKPTFTWKLLYENKRASFIAGDYFETMGYVRNYMPKNGDIIVDAGAFEGSFSMFVYGLLKGKAKIICFEPDKKNIAELKKNIKKYKIKNIKIIEKGLWSKKDNLFFKHDGFASKISNKNDSDYAISVTDLDSELKRIGVSRVDFIKMDIEGAEIEALKGMQKTLKNNKCNLAIASYHKINGKTSSKRCEEILKKNGYSSFTDYPRHLTTYAKK